MRKHDLIKAMTLAMSVVLSSNTIVFAAQDSNNLGTLKGQNAIEVIYMMNVNNNEGFKVSSAKFKSDKEIEVVFTDKVDKDYILYKDGRLIGENIKIILKGKDKKCDLKAVLSEDGTKLVITKADGTPFNGEYQIIVNEMIRSSKGAQIESFKTDISSENTKRTSNILEDKNPEKKKEDKENREYKKQCNDKCNEEAEKKCKEKCKEKCKDDPRKDAEKRCIDKCKENSKKDCKDKCDGECQKEKQQLKIKDKQDGSNIEIKTKEKTEIIDKNKEEKDLKKNKKEEKKAKEKCKDKAMIKEKYSEEKATIKEEETKEDREKATIKEEENKEDKEKATIKEEETKEDKEKATIKEEENKEDKENTTIKEDDKKEKRHNATETSN